MNSAKTESHYKVLGTTAKIGQGRIREKYIAAVKKHPPESDPEMFEKIRAAYEILKDPSKRKEYDLLRKYGDKVEIMIKKAFNYIEHGEVEQGKVLLEKALTIVPKNAAAVISLIQLCIEQEEMEQANNYFQKTLAAITENEEKSILYRIKARILEENGFTKEAFQLLDEGIRLLPEYSLPLDTTRAFLYLNLNKVDEAWSIFVRMTKDQDTQGEEHIEFYISLIYLFVEAEKWDQREWLKKQFSLFIKTLNAEEAQQDIYDRLIDEYEQYVEHFNYLAAEVFSSFASMIRKPDKEMQKELQEIKKIALLQKDVLRLERDMKAFPLLYIQVTKWFYSDDASVSKALEGIPDHLLAHLEEDSEEYAAGILYIKKKYPLIYKQYKKQWDDLFAELTKGFNREMKRMLSKMN